MKINKKVIEKILCALYFIMIKEEKEMLLKVDNNNEKVLYEKYKELFDKYTEIKNNLKGELYEVEEYDKFIILGALKVVSCEIRLLNYFNFDKELGCKYNKLIDEFNIIIKSFEI